MMRLQRVGRKNDPSYRIVVTDKRTGPKSNKHVAILGSYNPKMNHTQLDTDAAQAWLAKGVQPSDTVHNILVAQKVLDAKKLNVLPKKSPIVDEEAMKRAEEEAAAKAEAEKAEAEAVAAENDDTDADGAADAANTDTAAEATEESVQAADAEETPVEAGVKTNAPADESSSEEVAEEDEKE